MRQQHPKPWRSEHLFGENGAVLGNLLKPNLSRGRRVFKPKTRGEFTRNVLFFGFALLFVCGTFIAARWLFGKFASVETLAELLITRTLSLALFFFAGLLIFSNLVSAFTTFFLAPDLELLRSSPTSNRQLFIARYAMNWSTTSWSMYLFLLPMFWGAGPALNAQVWFYGVVLLSVIPLTLLCSILGCGVCVIMTRYLPAKRSRDVLVLLAIIAFVIGYVAFRLAEPEKFLEPGGFENLVSLISAMEADNQGFSPVYWVTDAALGTVSNEWSQVWLNLGLLYSTTIGLVYLTTMLCGGVYGPAYTSAHERPPSSQGQLKQRLAKWQPKSSPLHAIVRRDTQIFLRTPSQWTQLLLIGALVVVYLLNFKYFKSLQDTGILGGLGVYGINFGLSGLIIATLAVRFLFPSISLEGKAFWCIEAAPINANLLVRAKIRWGFPPILYVGVGLCIGAGLITQLSTPLLLMSVLITVAYTWTICNMGAYLGAFDPQFNLDNPARVASSMTAVVFMLSAMLLLVLLLGLSLQPMWLLERFLSHGHPPSIVSLSLGMGLLCVAIFLSIFAMRMSKKAGLKGLTQR